MNTASLRLLLEFSFTLSVLKWVRGSTETGSGTLYKVEEAENVTFSWPVDALNVTDIRTRPLIVRKNDIAILRYHSFGNSDNNETDRVFLADNHSVSVVKAHLQDAGVYRLYYEGKEKLNATLFVYGTPNPAKITQRGSYAECNVTSTSLPVRYRTNFIYTLYVRTLDNITSNYSSSERLYDLSGEAVGVQVSCSGRENGSTLQSQASEWINVTAYIPDTTEASANNSAQATVDDQVSLKLVHIVIIAFVSVIVVMIIIIIAVCVICCKVRKQQSRREYLEDVSTPDLMEPKGDDVSLVDNDIYSDNNSYTESDIDQQGNGFEKFKQGKVAIHDDEQEELYAEIRQTGPEITDLYAQVNKPKKKQPVD